MEQIYYKLQILLCVQYIIHANNYFALLHKNCALYFQIVNQISNDISEDTKEYIRSETNGTDKDNFKIWGENIQCYYIPYKPPKRLLSKLTKKPATASAFVEDFSMKYNKENVKVNGFQSQSTTRKTEQEPKVCFDLL